MADTVNNNCVSMAECDPLQRFGGVSIGVDRHGRWAPEPGTLVLLGHPCPEARADARDLVLIDWKRPEDDNWKEGIVGRVATEALLLPSEPDIYEAA